MEGSPGHRVLSSRHLFSLTKPFRPVIFNPTTYLKTLPLEAFKKILLPRSYPSLIRLDALGRGQYIFIIVNLKCECLSLGGNSVEDLLEVLTSSWNSSSVYGILQG